MDHMIEEIRGALRARLYMVALQSTLALIDVAGGVASETGYATGKSFRAWFRTNLMSRYPRFSADDAYQMRCGLLHEGSTRSKQYERVIITLPGGFRVHDGFINGAYALDCDGFCTDALDCIERWWQANRNLEPVKTNSARMLQFRENGLLPYLQGMPVIA